MGYAAFSIFTLLIFWWGYRRKRPIVRCGHPKELDYLKPYVRADGTVVQVPFWKKIQEREESDRYALIDELNRNARLKNRIKELEADRDALAADFNNLEDENQTLWAANQHLWEEKESQQTQIWNCQGPDYYAFSW